MEKNNNEIKQRICCYSKEFDVDLDYQETLEPYNDEMLKILRSSVSNSIVNFEYNNGALTVHGKTKINITYFNNSDKGISSAEFDEDFEKTINIEADENSHFDIRLCTKYNNARIINPTRVDIHNSFSVSVKIFSDKQCCSVTPKDNLLIKEKRVNCISYISSANVKSEFDDEASIPAESPAINRVVNSFSNAVEEEVKIVENKMLVRAKIIISILYLTDNNSFERFERVIAVNSILDMQGIAEDDVAFTDLTVSGLYIKPKADKNNEYRSFEIIGELLVNSAVYRETELIIPVDAYSAYKNSEPVFDTMELFSDYAIANETVTEKFSLKTDKQKISEVLDISASMSVNNSVEIAAFVADENSVNLISSRNKTDLNGYDEISVSIISSDYVIISEDEIEVRVNLAYKALKYNKNSFNIVNDVRITDGEAVQSPALTVYFADAGEEIWDIAKKFRTSEELIKKENDITKDKIDSKKILIIPGM